MGPSPVRPVVLWSLLLAGTCGLRGAGALEGGAASNPALVNGQEGQGAATFGGSEAAKNALQASRRRRKARRAKSPDGLHTSPAGVSFKEVTIPDLEANSHEPSHVGPTRTTQTSTTAGDTANSESDESSERHQEEPVAAAEAGHGDSGGGADAGAAGAAAKGGGKKAKADQSASTSPASAGNGTAQASAPRAPYFNFPPDHSKRGRTQAEEGLQEVLPAQQRLVKYLTDDRIFGTQVLLSLFFLGNALVFARHLASADDPTSAAGSRAFQSALVAAALKHLGTVLGRLQWSLVPHLVHEPRSRYAKFKARVALLAKDPAVQYLVYCLLFIAVPLPQALVPLILREAVWLLLVVHQALAIIAPGALRLVRPLFEKPASFMLTGGRPGRWRAMGHQDRQVLLGRRLAQLCFKLEFYLLVVFAAAQYGRTTGLSMANWAQYLKVAVFYMTLMQLLTVKYDQLGNDIHFLKNFKVGGFGLSWLETGVEFWVLGKMLGQPPQRLRQLALLGPLVFLLHPDLNPAMAEVYKSPKPFQTLRVKLTNMLLGIRGDNEPESEDEQLGQGAEDAAQVTKASKLAKMAAVALGISDE